LFIYTLGCLDICTWRSANCFWCHR